MFAVAHKTPTSKAECAALASAGATVFEVDVRLHRSGVIVSHFLPVLRIPGWLENDGPTFRRYRRSPQDRSLQETLELVPAPCRVLLDLKEDVPWRRQKLNARLAQLADSDRFLVSTHMIEDLAFFRGHGFETWRTIRSPREFRRAISGGIKDAGISIRHTLIDQRSLQELRALTKTVVAWTVNDVVNARRLVNLDVDGITTDSPEIMSMAKRAPD